MDSATLVDLMQLADQLEYSAEWREGKAFQYPEDEARNLEAASILRKLSEEVRALDGSDLHRAYHDLFEKDGDRAVEEEGQLTREVGFHCWPETGREFMEELIRRVERFNDLGEE